MYVKTVITYCREESQLSHKSVWYHFKEIQILSNINDSELMKLHRSHYWDMLFYIAKLKSHKILILKQEYITITSQGEEKMALTWVHVTSIIILVDIGNELVLVYRFSTLSTLSTTCLIHPYSYKHFFYVSPF